jgi:hypothetical protein
MIWTWVSARVTSYGVSRPRCRRSWVEAHVVFLTRPPPATPAPVPSGSFLSEQSFSHAPLRSRMPQLSPHRDVVHESILYDKDEQSSEGDVSLEELQEREQVTREREGLQKEDLRGLSNDLQEAVVVEDLLFVLMVSAHRFTRGL